MISRLVSWRLAALWFAATVVIVTMQVPAARANHGAAGDPNLALEAVSIDGAARRGSCSKVRVKVRNTSSQVSVTGIWKVALEILDVTGQLVGTYARDRDGLGHRWEERGGGLPDKAEAVFEDVAFPTHGAFTLRASVALASSRQKEYGLHDNTGETEVRVDSDCPTELPE